MEYRILIADDDVELVKMLRTFFELRKYMVITAADAEQYFFFMRYDRQAAGVPARADICRATDSEQFFCELAVVFLL